MTRAKGKLADAGRRAPSRSAAEVGAREFRRRRTQERKRVVAKPKSEPPKVWLSVEAGLRRVPLVAWLCVVVAFLNAAAWSVITPPFEAPDEPEHVSYVKQLAETSHLPTHQGRFSIEELVALGDLRLQYVAEDPAHQPISSEAQQAKLDRDLEAVKKSPEKGSEYAGSAASQPPLYYALAGIPYTLGKVGTLLDRIELMRLFSALMGGLTALFTFLFIRETLPRVPWAWTVGGLAVALTPLLGFESGVVTPDSMLYAVSAALFYALARGFRQGLTRAHAIALGVVIATGFSTKLNFVGLAPGALLGLILLSVRSAKTLGRSAYVSLAIALAVALSPVMLDLILHAFSGGRTSEVFSIASSVIGRGWGQVNYVWQLFLPKIPGTTDDFKGMWGGQLWYRGYIGLYGWLDTPLAGWVYELALLPSALIIGLAARSLVLSLSALRARALELGVYGVMVLGLLMLIGVSSYVVFPTHTAEFAQTRYLLPLLPLLGVVLALSARGAGSRWGPVVGVAIVMLFLGHDIFSQLQVIARFYA